MEWGAKHLSIVEGPRTVRGDRQRDNLDSDVEQDACTSVDESPGGLSLTDPRVEVVDAELASRQNRRTLARWFSQLETTI